MALIVRTMEDGHELSREVFYENEAIIIAQEIYQAYKRGDDIYNFAGNVYSFSRPSKPAERKYHRQLIIPAEGVRILDD